MYAVFATGGKQYRVSVGDAINIEKLELGVGADVEFDQVLAVGEGESLKIGAPFVAGGKISCKVVAQKRADKVRILKFRRRKHHMKGMGHRQYYTRIEVTGITGA